MGCRFEPRCGAVAARHEELIGQLADWREPKFPPPALRWRDPDGDWHREAEEQTYAEIADGVYQ
jgi:hypothetical protein